MSKHWTIYCHTHVDSGRRYIGLTKNTMMHRWNQHCAQARSSKGGRWHFPNAIRKYGKDAFSHEVLDTCDSHEIANSTEEAWIEFYDTRNPEKGFNLAKGGMHTPHPVRNPFDRPEFKAARIANLAKVNASTTPEQRSNRTKKLWNDPEFREQVITSSKLARSTPAAKLKESIIQKEVKTRPEVKARQIEASKETWRDPEYRANNAKLWEDSEFRDKCQSGLIHGAALNKSKIHCPFGHEYIESNTYVNPKGRRICLICKRLSGRDYMRRVRSVRTAGNVQ